MGRLSACLREDWTERPEGPRDIVLDLAGYKIIKVHFLFNHQICKIMQYCKNDDMLYRKNTRSGKKIFNNINNHGNDRRGMKRMKGYM